MSNFQNQKGLAMYVPESKLFAFLNPHSRPLTRSNWWKIPLVGVSDYTLAYSYSAQLDLCYLDIQHCKARQLTPQECWNLHSMESPRKIVLVLCLSFAAFSCFGGYNQCLVICLGLIKYCTKVLQIDPPITGDNDHFHWYLLVVTYKYQMKVFHN